MKKENCKDLFDMLDDMSEAYLLGDYKKAYMIYLESAFNLNNNRKFEEFCNYLDELMRGL